MMPWGPSQVCATLATGFRGHRNEVVSAGMELDTHAYPPLGYSNVTHVACCIDASREGESAVSVRRDRSA